MNLPGSGRVSTASGLSSTSESSIGASKRLAERAVEKLAGAGGTGGVKPILPAVEDCSRAASAAASTAAASTAAADNADDNAARPQCPGTDHLLSQRSATDDLLGGD